MDGTTIISILSLTGTLVGSMGGIIVSSKMTNYRLEQRISRLEKIIHESTSNTSAAWHEKTDEKINTLLLDNGKIPLLI
jgi:cell division protein FtsL